ncbi:MAG: 4'-phosphopantetheinyl transferase superfamily protein [Lentimicrobium sp.]|jgi:4'-phosphopantetheinyl transferase|nr:4'-phosphopantetheinyl transferase superfamily protein [Lentimicrobium sp.]
MTELFAIRLIEEAAFEQLKPALLKLLPSETCDKINAFARSNDAQRSLLGEIMARHLLHKATGETLPDEPFITGEKGKPAHDGFRGIYFNITHSGDWVVVALSLCRVGVDVEKMRKVPQGVAQRFFSEVENQWMDSATNEAGRKDIFFTLWTLKESFLKAIGTGLTKSLSSFTIVHQENRHFELEQNEETNGFKLFTFEFMNGYKLSACSEDGEFEPRVNILNIEELIF